MLVLGLDLGLASSGLGLDVADLVNITAYCFKIIKK
jgi:hypothetical protein